MVKFFFFSEIIHWENPQVRTGKLPNKLLEIEITKPDYIGQNDHSLEVPDIPSIIKSLYSLYRQFMAIKKDK